MPWQFIVVLLKEGEKEEGSFAFSCTILPPTTSPSPLSSSLLVFSTAIVVPCVNMSLAMHFILSPS